MWSRHLTHWQSAKSLEISREILLLGPHPSKKNRFPFWVSRANSIYNPRPKNL